MSLEQLLEVQTACGAECHPRTNWSLPVTFHKLRFPSCSPRVLERAHTFISRIPIIKQQSSASYHLHLIVNLKSSFQMPRTMNNKALDQGTCFPFCLSKVRVGANWVPYRPPPPTVDRTVEQAVLRSMRLRSYGIDCIRISILGRWGLSEPLQLRGTCAGQIGVAELWCIRFWVRTCSLRHLPWRCSEHTKRSKPLSVPELVAHCRVRCSRLLWTLEAAVLTSLLLRNRCMQAVIQKSGPLWSVLYIFPIVLECWANHVGKLVPFEKSLVKNHVYLLLSSDVSSLSISAFSSLVYIFPYFPPYVSSLCGLQTLTFPESRPTPIFIYTFPSAVIRGSYKIPGLSVVVGFAHTHPKHIQAYCKPANLIFSWRP